MYRISQFIWNTIAAHLLAESHCILQEYMRAMRLNPSNTSRIREGTSDDQDEIIRYAFKLITRYVFYILS